MGIVEQYLLQLNSEKRRWRRAAAILVVLSLFVASGVSWNLRMTGTTIANGAACGADLRLSRGAAGAGTTPAAGSARDGAGSDGSGGEHPALRAGNRSGAHGRTETAGAAPARAYRRVL